MREYITRALLRVGDARADTIAAQPAGVADLPARLAVERRLVEHDLPAFAGFELGDLLAVAHQRRDHTFGTLGVVAEEFRRPKLLAQRKPDRLGRGFARAGPRGARLGLLALHRGVERVG